MPDDPSKKEQSNEMSFFAYREPGYGVNDAVSCDGAPQELVVLWRPSREQHLQSLPPDHSEDALNVLVEAPWGYGCRQIHVPDHIQDQTQVTTRFQGTLPRTCEEKQSQYARPRAIEENISMKTREKGELGSYRVKCDLASRLQLCNLDPGLDVSPQSLAVVEEDDVLRGAVDAPSWFAERGHHHATGAAAARAEEVGAARRDRCGGAEQRAVLHPPAEPRMDDEAACSRAVGAAATPRPRVEAVAEEAWKPEAKAEKAWKLEPEVVEARSTAATTGTATPATACTPAGRRTPTGAIITRAGVNPMGSMSTMRYPVAGRAGKAIGRARLAGRRRWAWG